jgi:endonuclease/exonuclease/phosphatase family metal-dependent hydrolase
MQRPSSSLGDVFHLFWSTLDGDSVHISVLKSPRDDVFLLKYNRNPHHGSSAECEPNAEPFMNFGTASRSLKIVNYNIWNFAGPKDVYEGRMKAIAQQIKDADADIVTLQEVRLTNYEHPTRRGSRGSQIDELGQLLPSYNYVFEPAMAYINEDPSVFDAFEEHKWQVQATLEGLAIMSKLPIAAWNKFVLTRNLSDAEDSHQRAALHAQVHIRDSSFVDVVTTHSSLSESARQRNSEELGRLISRFGKHSSQPLIVTGDFNEEHEGQLPKLLAKSSLSGNPRCTDAVVAAANSSDTWTFITLHASPRKRIDFTFVCPHSSSIVSWEPIATDKYMISRATASPHAPSDHRATQMTLMI